MSTATKPEPQICIVVRRDDRALASIFLWGMRGRSDFGRCTKARISVKEEVGSVDI